MIGATRPSRKQGHDVAHEGVGRCSLLGDVAPAQHRADDRQPLPQDRHDRQRRPTARDRPDAHDAALRRGRVHVGDHVVAADRVESHVRAPAGCFDDGPRERVDIEGTVGGTSRFDARIEPELAAPFELVRVPRGTDDVRAHRVRELQRRGADARSDRVHEHPLARSRRVPA